MRYRPLGRSGLRVSELFLGAMTFADGFVHGAGRYEARRIIDMYADAGGNVIDTAINYRDGRSEEIVGEVLESRRDRFVLATKYSVTRDPHDPNAGGNARKNLRLSLETSLRRLRTDYIDLYYVHMWDSATPIEETMRALDDAVRDGKILYTGISDAPAWVVARANTLAEWRGWSPFVALQVPYSLLRRDAERELIPVAEALGLSVVIWGALASGTLSGKFATGAAESAEPTRVDRGSLSEHDLEVADAVAGIAAERGISSSQVALAWTRAKTPHLHPVLGVRTVEQLEDNIRALRVELTHDELERLREVSPFEVGFPTDFITGMRQFVFGTVDVQVDRD